MKSRSVLFKTDPGVQEVWWCGVGLDLELAIAEEGGEATAVLNRYLQRLEKVQEVVTRVLNHVQDHPGVTFEHTFDGRIFLRGPNDLLQALLDEDLL
jgi:hypothetical protein